MSKRKCKCKICKAELTVGTAYKVINGTKNEYYCNEEEYSKFKKEHGFKNKAIQVLRRDIFKYSGKEILPPIVVKKMNELNKVFDYEIIYETIIRNGETLVYWAGQTSKYKSDFSRATYILTIIKNKINDVAKAVRSEREKFDNMTVGVDLATGEDMTAYYTKPADNVKPSKNIKDISRFLD